MNRDMFENNTNMDEQLLTSSDSDFDAELMALLGEDLYKELAPQKPAPAK